MKFFDLIKMTARVWKDQIGSFMIICLAGVLILMIFGGIMMVLFGLGFAAVIFLPLFGNPYLILAGVGLAILFYIVTAGLLFAIYFGGLATNISRQLDGEKVGFGEAFKAGFTNFNRFWIIGFFDIFATLIAIGFMYTPLILLIYLENLFYEYILFIYIGLLVVYIPTFRTLCLKNRFFHILAPSVPGFSCALL